jgi:hypothetical protein
MIYEVSAYDFSIHEYPPAPLTCRLQQRAKGKYVLMGGMVASRTGGTFDLPPSTWSTVIKDNPGTRTLDLQIEVACIQRLTVPPGTPFPLYGKLVEYRS